LAPHVIRSQIDLSRQQSIEQMPCGEVCQVGIDALNSVEQSLSYGRSMSFTGHEVTTSDHIDQLEREGFDAMESFRRSGGSLYDYGAQTHGSLLRG